MRLRQRKQLHARTWVLRRWAANARDHPHRRVFLTDRQPARAYPIQASLYEVGQGQLARSILCPIQPRLPYGHPRANYRRDVYASVWNLRCKHL